MKTAKVIGMIVLVVAGLAAIYYFMSKKLEGATQDITSGIKSAAGDLKSGIIGDIVGTVGSGVKSLVTGLTSKTKTGAGLAAAGTAASFVGPLQPTATAAGGMATTGGIFSGMSTVGIAGVAAGVGLWLYGMGQAIGLFPRKKDAMQQAIDAKLQAAREAGIPIVSKIQKVQLKAPDKR